VANNVYTYYLPFLANGYKPSGVLTGSFTTFLAFQNVGSAPANVTVSYVDANGIALSANTITNLAQFNESIASNPFAVGSKGAAIITSNQPLNVVVPEATPFGGSAYVVTAGTASTLNAPFAFHNTFGGYFTQLSIFNAGASATNVTVKFYDTAGNSPVNSTKRMAIAPNQTAILDQTAADSNIPIGFNGWAQITGDTSSLLAVQALEQNPNTGFVAIANAQAAPTSSTVVAPAIFNKAYSSFVTGASIINPNSFPVTVTVNYYDLAGILTSTAPFPIPAFGLASVYQGSNSGGLGLPGSTGLPSGFAGAAVVQSSGGNVLMAVNEYGGLTANGTAKSGTYLAAASGGSQVGLPVVANNGFGYITGDTIFNNSAQTVTANIRYINYATGASTPSSTCTLTAYASQAFYQGAAGLPTGFYGTAVVTETDGPPNALLVTTNALSDNFFYTFTEPN
jgi:hypothetical protein